jgi:hypothetical protein
MKLVSFITRHFNLATSCNKLNYALQAETLQNSNNIAPAKHILNLILQAIKKLKVLCQALQIAGLKTTTTDDAGYIRKILKTHNSEQSKLSQLASSGVPRGGGGGGGRPGRRREGGAKMGIKAQGPGNDFFNRPTRAGWDHCQCHEVHVS